MMTKTLTFLVAVCCLGFLALAAADSDVVVLTDANFYEHIKEGDWLVEFYAPWCGHCKKLAPTWEELATSAKEHGFKVAKVDCTVEKQIPNLFGIRGYPTIKFIRGDKYYDFASQRTIEKFTEFAKGGYQTADTHPLPPPPTVAPAAAPTTAGEKKEEASGAAVETVKREDAKDVEDGVVVLTEKNFVDTTKEGLWMLEFYAPWCGHCKRLAPTWAELSSQTAGKFKVGKVDCTVEKAICGKLGVKGYPTIKLRNGDKLYAYQGARTVEAFQEFANGGYASASSSGFPSFEEVKLETKSDAKETVGEYPKEVIVLTESNFDEKIATGDWLVEFYAPWCGHCKKLAPTWEELATKGKTNVAKVDCTVEKNLAKRFGIKGFPTIKYIRDGKVFDYKGQRTVEAFTSFVNSEYGSASSGPLPAATAPAAPAAAAGVKHDEL
ncbi:Protein disulfide-isomerase A6 [Balamuthia mandrillaris]